MFNLLFLAILGSLVTDLSGQILPNTSFVKRVHVTFMNHLDVGYNDPYRNNEYYGYSVNVVNQYFDTYFKRALNTSFYSEKLLNQTYTYTTHCWLLSLYFDCPPNMGLHCPTQEERQDMINGIEKGWIRWHAFPFNSEAETHDYSLFEFGLNLCKSMSQTFNTPQSIVMSQRDVPGTTKAIIPILKSNGVEAISIGANGGSAPPVVPNIFKWMDKDQWVIGMLHPGGYGGTGYKDCIVIDNYEEALCMAFKGDNQGAQDFPEYVGILSKIKAEFPSAQVFASTFTSYITTLLSNPHVVDELPIIQDDIGDTWIHGMQADSFKQAAGRTFMRNRNRCLYRGECSLNSYAFFNFSRLLLKNCEHTWGGDIKHFLNESNKDGPYYYWTNQQLQAGLAENNGDNLLTNFRGTWYEQRRWALHYAHEALLYSNDPNDINLYNDIHDDMQRIIDPQAPNLDGFTQTDVSKSFNVINGQNIEYTIQFDSSTGAITTLTNTNTSVDYASSTNPLALFYYLTLTEDDFIGFIQQYSMQPDESWVEYDFGKQGLADDAPFVTHQYLTPTFQNLYINDDSNVFIVETNMGTKNDDLKINYGGSDVMYSVFNFTSTHSTFFIDFYVINKTGTRMPEVLFYSFNPPNCKQWYVEKLFQDINPDYTVMNGSYHQHGVFGNTTCERSDDTIVYIDSIDSGLVALKPQDATEFTGFPTPFVKPDYTEGIAFILNDNLWGTNYPMWYPYDERDTNQTYRFYVHV